MKEDWMEGFMNIDKLMQMIINKIKGYLKDDQLGFKYQYSLHKGNNVWINEWYSDHMLAIACTSQTRLWHHNSSSPVWSTCIKLTAEYIYGLYI